MTLDLDDCRRARNRWLFALKRHKDDDALRLLMRVYLPALRDFAMLTDPERIRDEMAVLAGRLTKGWDYRADTEDEQQEAEDLWDELLNDYETLGDALNLGTTPPPTVYLMSRKHVDDADHRA